MTMTKLIVGSLAALLAISCPFLSRVAHAQGGPLDCLTWLADHYARGSMSLIEDAWLDGFIARATEEDSSISNEWVADTDGHLAYVNDYCTAHPGGSVIVAADNIVLNMKRGAGVR